MDDHVDLALEYLEGIEALAKAAGLTNDEAMGVLARLAEDPDDCWLLVRAETLDTDPA
jgi:hypothetical protein